MLHAALAKNQRINTPPTMPQTTPKFLRTLLVLAAPVAAAWTTFKVALGELSAAMRFSATPDVDDGIVADEVIKKPCWSYTFVASAAPAVMVTTVGKPR